jgi:chromosome segregation ATPase
MNVTFLSEEQGYCKEQVESYIDKLSGEYQALHGEYAMLAKQYKDMADEKKVTDAAAAQLKAQNVSLQKTVRDLNQQAAEVVKYEPSAVERDAIAQALIDAETLARQIVARATDEAVNTVAQAQSELAKLQSDRDVAVAAITNLWNAISTTPDDGDIPPKEVKYYGEDTQ